MQLICIDYYIYRILNLNVVFVFLVQTISSICSGVSAARKSQRQKRNHSQYSGTTRSAFVCVCVWGGTFDAHVCRRRQFPRYKVVLPQYNVLQISPLHVRCKCLLIQFSNSRRIFSSKNGTRRTDCVRVLSTYSYYYLIQDCHKI